MQTPDTLSQRSTVDGLYASAISELDRMSGMTPAQLRARDIAGDYESAIINVAIIFDKALDVVICDLQAHRAGRRSQEVAA